MCYEGPKAANPSRLLVSSESVASAYAVLGDVRVVVLTQPDRSNTLMALHDEIERL